jgi:hypothetical protein
MSTRWKNRDGEGRLVGPEGGLHSIPRRQKKNSTLSWDELTAGVGPQAFTKAAKRYA